MDIIVTTPKSQMAVAAQEAADCLAANGGEYVRRFPLGQAPKIFVGDRVYYVEDGYVRGRCRVTSTYRSEGQTCDTTGRRWGPGFYVFMAAPSWQWMRPVPMKGFQGYRYAPPFLLDPDSKWPSPQNTPRIEIVGGWRDPKPEARPSDDNEIVVQLLDAAGHDKGYAIRCPDTGYWRSVDPIEGDMAWTRDGLKRAVFATENDARRELEAVWRWRAKQATA